MLDALAALNDPELTEHERRVACLQIMYPDWDKLPDIVEAFKTAMEFINCGEPVPEYQAPKPTLVDWDADAGVIAPAVDQVLGYSCRRAEYLHWWEFVGAYQNIGCGLFAQVVGIRSKQAKGQQLDAAEREFLRDNAALVGRVAATKPTSEEEQFFKSLGV